MWIEIPKKITLLTEDSKLHKPPAFIKHIKKDLDAVPGSVVMIECKNEYDIERPASAYEIVQSLEIPTVLPLSVEGHGISPLLNALYISNLHLRSSASSVIIVATSSQKKSLEWSAQASAKNELQKKIVILYLSLEKATDYQSSVCAIFYPVLDEKLSNNFFKVSGNIDFKSLPISPNCKWFIREVSSKNNTALSPLLFEDVHIPKEDYNSCFDFIKNLPAMLVSNKGILLQY